MKRILLISFVLCIGLSLSAQKQQLHIKVINHKGKAYHNINAYLKSEPKAQKVDRNGEVSLIRDVTDTLFLLYNDRKAIIPVNDQNNILVRIEKESVYELSENELQKQVEVIQLPRFNPSDIQSYDLTVYRSLADLLIAKYPTLELINNTVFIRGNQTTNSGKIPALIVLNGSPMISFEQVNGMVSIFEVKSIEVKRSDILYGMRGVGGIIEITTIDHK